MLDLTNYLLVFVRASAMLAVFPLFATAMSRNLALDVIERTAQTFKIGILIVAPIMAVSFVITLVYSTLSRAVPQVNVFSDSFSVRILAGLFVFAMTCHLMAQNIENCLRRLPEDMLRVAQLMGHG